ncbi:hypothetical protein O3G_MSEX004259 [Manduca sexta]|uniref:C2H2-type domain-containing protein n=1 Tax=Manduca sexta TaxID=7130 RepID=A0A921YU90_MANSE|nr:hypothetical protein O3G_MSEX004259 [Manduca sexta]
MSDDLEPNPKRVRLLRGMDWLKNQNSETKKSQQNKNDIQFIIQTNADRKKFLLNAAEDEASVPAGVNESSVEPKAVPLNRLRLDKLHMECEWHTCRKKSSDYEEFQKHIQTHISDVKPVVDKNESVEYACLWDVCGHITPDFNEMVRHINYHAYHAKLLAIGFNGRATLKLVRCRKDSSKRNQLPKFIGEHVCMWTGCQLKYSSIQAFFDHIKQHIAHSENLQCSWAGCGAIFNRRTFLTIHMRIHTRERLIACYHCGVHFTCNRKLCDHLRRQNVNPNSAFACSLCGTLCATEYLLNEHARQHVSAYVCALCDMSAPTPAALAHHVRYRHLPPAAARLHACQLCAYRAVTQSDLRKHLRRTHNKEKAVKKAEGSDPDDFSDDSDAESKLRKKKSTKKYACHLCPEKHMKIFSRGYRLTTHLVKEHGAQWPHGHSRFRYQISEDGMYRLTTTRYEVLEVFKKIVDRDSGPNELLTNKFEFKLQQTAEPTETTPRQFEIAFKNETEMEKFEKTIKNDEKKDDKTKVEIVMCDVDEEGNIIRSEVMN